ncbi:hypothetical protein K474DRAFT_1624239 [Panus rudis PR-1116 ss-1]|nr:hypothetical protein K474DRAFT_1624239 [Panus rudis PR-1116 ss-1]
MAALAAGIRKAVETAGDQITEIHIYVDNKAAAQAILAANRGPSQMVSVMAARSARQFLERDEQRKIFIWWCPSHEGIIQNEFVDQAAKEALELPQPNFVSYSVARQRFTARAVHKWHKSMDNPSYRGHHNVARIQDLRKCGPSNKQNPFLRLCGKSNPAFARLTRFLSGHFPHGEFRQRFHLEGPRQCACGYPLETRDHILYDCPLWIRPKSLKRPREPSRAMRNALILDEEDEQIRMGHPSIKTIYQFLDRNPMVATFEWADLLSQAAEEQNEGEGPHWAQVLVKAHTVIKVALYRRLCESHNGDTREFFNTYDASVVAHKLLNRLRPPGTDSGTL